MPSSFETNLDKYAELAIKVGLNLQAGQALLIDAPLESAPLVRLAAKHAYQGGARLVEVFWRDEALTRIRFQYAPRDSFGNVSEGQVRAAKGYAEQGDAFLGISGQDPDLLRDQDPALVAEYQKALAEKFRPVNELAMRDAYNWLVLAAPSKQWAARVFPHVPTSEQTARLWDAIFSACRVYESDPVAAWQQHVRELSLRRDELNQKRYDALHFFASETDLTVGLVEDHLWVGASTPTQRGLLFVGNMPTEEVFTMPHRARVNGIVTATLPLSIRSRVIDKFTVTFENGRVTNAVASNDQAVLDELLATDEGARHLGEVALVPHSSPISKTGILFFNALFDENAASHLALGKSYPTNIRNGSHLSEMELAQRGANDSLIHLDFMIGSSEMNVDGIRADGSREPIMRNGEWAFALGQ